MVPLLGTYQEIQQVSEMPQDKGQGGAGPLEPVLLLAEQDKLVLGHIINLCV